MAAIIQSGNGKKYYFPFFTSLLFSFLLVAEEGRKDCVLKQLIYTVTFLCEKLKKAIIHKKKKTQTKNHPNPTTQTPVKHSYDDSHDMKENISLNYW